MASITLPDGNQRHYAEPMTIHDIAKDISISLAKNAIGGIVDGAPVDMSFVVDRDCNLSIITEKMPEALSIIRHSAAHLMAQAVQRLFPAAQVTIGPVIEDGFFYDFAFDRPFTPEDLTRIEAEMRSIVKENLPVSRRVISRNDAIALFREKGEHYKVEIIESIPESDMLSLYQQGEFEDLCRGPHVPSTGFIKAFKLTKLAGAYWRGDSTKPMLQRIYGTAWPDKESLAIYLHRLEEAEKRDHRKIGKALDLFHFQDIAPGMVFWHPDGFTIYNILESYIRDQLSKFGYQEIKTPQLVDKVLWEKSGHWANFREEMFVTEAETENRQYVVKPMSCPCHVQVYNQGLKSYRDLPLRFAEFGNCHRCEPSGALHGLMRVRNMVQDDGHIFCVEDDIQSEVAKILQMVQNVYRDFGFDSIRFRLALRPEKRVGSDEVWDKAEHALATAMKEQGIVYEEAPGDGAFYGPKIECSLSDCIGRIWQCGTIQVDFSTPERLDATYVDVDGSRKAPVMIHRAILGSLERFMGILIEHHAGKFPLWLSPKQVMVLTISDKQLDFAHKVTDFLKINGIRANLDLRNEKIGFKIREHTMQKIPYLFVIGDKEVERNEVSVRTQDGTDLGCLSLELALEHLQKEIFSKGKLNN